MKLFLLRHAEAEDHAPSDAARPLTQRGVEQARTAGHFCARTKIEPELILFSPFLRAEQTARAFAEAWQPDSRTLQPAPFASSGMDPAAALRELRAFERFDRVMLVGHQPDLGLLAATLLGLRDAGNFPVGKASRLSSQPLRDARHSESQTYGARTGKPTITTIATRTM